MTGLDVDNDSIMSLCCLITDAELNLLDDKGFDATIHHDKEVLDEMDDWCIRTHGCSGLTAACIASTTTAEEAATGLLEYICHYVPTQHRGLLAGNSVHADKAFLRKPPFNKVINHLTYRILDVTSIKEAAMRWAPGRLKGLPEKMMLHQAREDILESIEEARFYRDEFFQKEEEWGTEQESVQTLDKPADETALKGPEDLLQDDASYKKECAYQ